MALTVLGAIIPGSGLLAAGRRVLGAIVLSFLVVAVAVGLWAGLTQRRELLHLAVEPSALLTLGAVLAVLGVIWVGVIVVTHRVVRPPDASTGQRLLGSALVTILALAVLLPMVVGSRYAFVQHEFVTNVFAGEESRSETRPTNATRENPWAGQDRVNVLLLGSDAAESRDGIRPDTTIVASIDTNTGQTTLFSLPRNLMNIPFPEDSKLAEAYPDGIFTGPDNWQEYMLLAMYRNVPAQHPNLLDSDHPGADAMKLGVGESLGLRLDYFVMINLQGFQSLIDALGGITVNVNTPVPIGGSDESGIPPSGWIEPGPDQKLDGFHALWFARGRYGSSDYARMDRQRCVINAIVDEAEPARLLRRFEDVITSSANIIETDIPGERLPAFVDLALLVKDAELNSIVFNDEEIDPADPDYDLMRKKVKAALAEASAGAKPSKAEQDKGENSPSPKDEPTEEPTKEPDEAGGKGSASDSVADSCAYNPEAE